MRKRAFYPTADGSLEDRLALSTTGASVMTVAQAHVLAAKSVKHPVVTAKQVSRVNVQVDTAFNQFNREYSQELKTLTRTANQTRFHKQFTASVAKLRKSLVIDANRLPFGKATLNPSLQARVDALVTELETRSSLSASDLVAAEQTHAHQDVNTFIQDEASKGDISLK
jgi:hypothetical protein